MPEIWDCFLFNNELDLLEYRFRLLDGHVDKFVVVEAARTFAGDPKPAFFAKNASRFADWPGKIRHVVADLPVEAPDVWAREGAQRLALRKVVEDAPNDTLLVVGDVDEVPRPEA